MKIKQNYSISGSRVAMDKQAKKAYKQFRQARKAGRGKAWLVKEAAQMRLFWSVLAWVIFDLLLGGKSKPDN